MLLFPHETVIKRLFNYQVFFLDFGNKHQQQPEVPNDSNKKIAEITLFKNDDTDSDHHNNDTNNLDEVLSSPCVYLLMYYLFRKHDHGIKLRQP